MTDSEARELESELGAPGRTVSVEAEPGGAEITIEAPGERCTYSIRDGRSRLLSTLLTGHAG